MAPAIIFPDFESVSRNMRNSVNAAASQTAFSGLGCLRNRAIAAAIPIYTNVVAPFS